MKEETKFLIDIADRFDDDAQDVLDFVAKNGNLEKAAKALAGVSKPATPTGARMPLASETSSIDKLSDGVYFIAGTSDSEINTKTYVKYEPNMTAAPILAKYIGVKLGHRAIAVALEDLPGDKNGILQPKSNSHTSPETSEHYSFNKETNEYRFNAIEDFDGKGNTTRLKSNGCKINLPDGEWIPSIGELGLLMMHATDVNRAIELVGGKPIKDWYWSSTEYSQSVAWFVGFSNGYTNISYKDGSNAVRAVAAF